MTPLVATDRILNIKFQAFIPGSIGKPMRDHFSGNIMNSELMKNYEEFNNTVNRIPGSWLSEPGTGMFGYYFKTDDREFGEAGTSRLKSWASINLSNVGNMSQSGNTDDRFRIFQHADDSSERYNIRIRNLNSAEDSKFLGQAIYGMISGPMVKTSSASSSEVLVNTVLGTYFTAPGTPRSAIQDATLIETNASAGYPFLEPLSPNIDYKFKLTLHKQGSFVNVKVAGQHNLFPFYELVVGNEVKYQYDAVANGETGPNPINLNRIRNFSVEWTEKLT